MGQEKNAENIPFLRSTQPKSTERVPVVELSGYDQGYTLAGAKKHLKHRKTAVAQATEGRAAVSPNVVEELRNIRDSIKNFLL